MGTGMTSFDTSETLEKTVGIVADQMGMKPDKVLLDSTLESLGVDSLDMVELIMKFEEQFGIEIEDDHIVDLKTLKEMVKYIQVCRTK